MMVTLTIAVYQQKQGSQYSWTTLTLDEARQSVHGRSLAKLQRKLVQQLRVHFKQLDQSAIEYWRLPRGIELKRERLSLSLAGPFGRRRIHGRFPLIITPRWVNADERVRLVCHPARQDDWFVLDPHQPLIDQAARFFSAAWSSLSDDDIEELTIQGKDQIKLVSFSTQVPSLLERYKAKQKQEEKQRSSRERKPVLEAIGSNQTTRVIDGTLPLGAPRRPYRDQLARLLTGARKQSAVVLGPNQCGKTTIIRRLVADLLDADDFPAHRNLDKVHQVWLISGKRIIAGMSYLGDWEERCFDLLVECRKRRAVLWVDDLHLFGRIGQSRDSERSLAQVLRGPVSRGQLLMIGECTPEQWQRLEDDAPGFAELFGRVVVHPTSAAETLQLMIDEARALELRHRCRFHPHAFRSLVEVAGSLFSHGAFPGTAMSLLRALARNEGAGDDGTAELREISAEHVMELVSRRTGVPVTMLNPQSALNLASVRRGFESRVMGQPAAVEVACTLTSRVRAGMTDPERPYAVMLFTGPTGTGKTEMARCIAEQLYGDPSRLVRFDMSEYAGAGAVARLIGDRYEPNGQLTSRLRQQPFCVLLLDEIEKAHRSVLYLLLQLFDEGRLTDAAGNLASFHHAVVVMTSNLGSRASRPIGFGESVASLLADIDKAVREHFPPELFNRIDQVVPFHPLDTEAAQRIVEKELARVLSRRGLAERNVFVYANQQVKRRIVEQAFDATLGARTVKRYIEDHIGSLLAQHLSRGGRATMQVIRIYEKSGDYRLHVEPLVEASPEPARFVVEKLAAMSALGLLERAPEQYRRLQALKRRVAKLRREGSEQSRTGEARYYLDHYDEQLDQWIDWFDQRLDLEREPEEPRAYAHERIEDPDGYSARRVRRFDPRRTRRRRPANKEQLLGAFVEVSRLARHFDQLTDLSLHKVTVELLRMGQHQKQRILGSAHQPGLFEWMARGYALPNAFTEAVVRYEDGSIRSLKSPQALGEALARRATHVMMTLSALCIRDRFAGEVGSHIWRSTAAEPEIVRVRLLDDASPLPELMRAHLASQAAFEQALEKGTEPLPPNPEQLDAAARTLSFSPPIGSQASLLVEVEDFRRSYAASLQVSSFNQLLAKLWQLWDGRVLIPAEEAGS